MTQDQYRCEECGADFGNPAGLEEHNRLFHARYTCEVCGAVMTSERDLEEHTIQVHPELSRTPRP